jgi:hypothetical protein
VVAAAVGEPALSGLVAAARLLADEGQIEHAVELYALAAQNSFVASSRWLAGVAGDRLAEVTAGLPAERVAILQERGRARAPQATAAEVLAALRR